MLFQSGKLESGGMLRNACGNKLQEPVLSPKKSMTVRLHLSPTRSIANFEGSVYKGCGGELNVAKGKIQSPNYPENYDNNVYCIWYITVAPDNMVNIQFKDLDIETSEGCIGDKLQIYDGPNKSSSYGYQFCGTNTTMYFLSSRNQATVVFQTDSSGTAKGMWLYYSSKPVK
ncbi:hypothetical protein PHET_00481 [Paragonimus heterotremus]|uniref:CUB domain-containing protein n=1 Tax=Paragonimus heterotremus TaxID=100268 RepID=A0A8J4TST7_9TREM|nr:hypothetical protein PHET_00481 [Paragonimus heterotremus]